MESERGSLAVEAIDASANIEPVGLGTEPSDANEAIAADGCTDDGMYDDKEDGDGTDGMDDAGIGHGLGVSVGPSHMIGVGVGVAAGTGTGAPAVAVVCTCTAEYIEGNGDNDESRPCPREPRRVDEGESVEPT